MAGRIESYLHSDNMVKNKGGCLVRVTCETDFAARTDEFINFTKLVARMTYAANPKSWADVVEMFPDAAEKKAELEKLLKEKIELAEFTILNL